MSQLSSKEMAYMIEEGIPLMLGGLYKGCLKQGFTEVQAMQIVLQYIATTLAPPRGNDGRK